MTNTRIGTPSARRSRRGRIPAILLAGALLFSVTACGDDAESGDGAGTTAAAATTAEAGAGSEAAGGGDTGSAAESPVAESGSDSAAPAGSGAADSATAGSAPAESGTAPAGSGGVAADEAIKIGLSTKTDTNPFFVKMREAAQDYAEDKNVEIVALAGKFDGDNEGQVAAIENLVSQGVKGILITPNSSTGILQSIKQARDAGVVVIALDTATDPEDAVDATFATDNLAAGVMQGKWVSGTLGDTAPKVLMLDGTPGGTVDQFRHDGFLEGMGLTEDDPAVAGMEDTNGDQTKAQTAMENLLQRVPDVNAVYTINEPAAAGGYAALEAAGKAGDVVMGSIDGSCTGVQNVKDGKIGATVMQFPSKMAEQGIDAIIGYANDGSKPSGFNDTGAELITDNPVDGLDSHDTAWGLENCWG